MKRDLWLRSPVHVDFNLTNGCNLSCSHCHSSSGTKLKKELSLKKILMIIDELHSLGVLSIAFAGGEPFIRRDIIDILSYACSLSGWSVSVITNGLFFDYSNMLEKLVSFAPDIKINISLDGSTHQNFSILRRQANSPNRNSNLLFDKIVDGIRAVVKSGLQNSINFTLTRPTLSDILQTYQLGIEELGAGGMVAIKFFPGGYGQKHLDLLEIPYSIWNKEFVKLTKLKLLGKIPKMQISIPAPWEFYLPLIEAKIDLKQSEQVWGYRSPLRESEYNIIRNIGDVAGVAELSIAANGIVYPSVLFTGLAKMECGDLREQSLQYIWKNSPVLTELRSINIQNIAGSCVDCGIKGLCGGGSRSRAYSGLKSITASDYACPIVSRKVDNAQKTKIKCLPKPQNNIKISDSLLEEKNVSKVKILGDGIDAVRIFFEEMGCEIRFQEYVIHCNKDLAHLLDIVLESNEESMLLKTIIEESKHNKLDTIIKRLNNLTKKIRT